MSWRRPVSRHDLAVRANAGADSRVDALTVAEIAEILSPSLLGGAVARSSRASPCAAWPWR